MNKNFRFIFYDYETFGLHTSLDKPSQFSSVVTDFQFNIIDDKKIIYCYPPIDYLPDPQSVLITGITPNYAKLVGYNEAVFSKKINYIFSQSNSCILGYNNIKFDDEFTRNIFYRNLIDPYSWSWKNKNSRWDIYILLISCYVFRPEIINWSKNFKGKISFKLRDVTSINQIKHIHVHDARSDVHATIELVKLIRKKNVKFFNFLFKNRKKNSVINLINLYYEQPVIYVSNLFGVKRYFMRLIILVQWHQYNKNIYIAYDLSQNIIDLIKYLQSNDICSIDEQILFNKGLIYIHVNRCPVLLPMSVLRSEDQKRLGIDLQYYFNKFAIFKKNIHILKKININKFFNMKMQNLNNVDLKIYDRFLNLHDSLLIQKMNNIAPHLIAKKLLIFNDPRMNEIFFRYKARNFPKSLNSIEKIMWIKHCRQYFNVEKLRNYESILKKYISIFFNNKNKVKLLKKVIIYYKQLLSKIF